MYCNTEPFKNLYGYVLEPRLFMFIYDSGDDENLTDSVTSLEDANQVIVNAQ